VNKVYICHNLSLANEMYFSITLDRVSTGLVILSCSKGRTSIEDLAEKYPDMIIKVPIDIFKGITDEDAAKVVEGLAPKFVDRYTSINGLFYETKCTLLDINPIAKIVDGQLVVVEADLNYIGLDGEIGCMVNGPRLAMARAFGDFFMKDFGLIVVPDVSYSRLNERDEFIILVSDEV
jgi:succinyl-CoA synthetase beta subunit